ncbi:MAG TPA: dihydropteroate synthase [Chloroflexi bacterium]|jgi:5-methyltetrahydrofolate--homocysteine methyltransferase|nr:dihydropteroate synthase [Chloroflexota bacterium]
METIIRSKSSEVVISPDRPTVIIGERINPTGKKRLAASLAQGDMSRVQQLARSQIQDGATVLDINVGAAGVNEVEVLPLAVKAVSEITDLPLCLDSANAEALRAALEAYEGKALINSVNGEEESLNRVLPLVKEYGAAVIGLTMDDSGIPNDAASRVAIARKIIERAEAMGIPREDVLIDCLALSVCTDSTAARTTLEAIRGVREELDVNLTLGASNVSFGLPDREAINNIFLAMSIAWGVNAPIVNPQSATKAILIADLLMGRDEYGMNYVTYYRQHADKP